MSTSQLIAAHAAAALIHSPSSPSPSTSPPFQVRLFTPSDLDPCRSLLLVTSREFVTDGVEPEKDPYLAHVLKGDMGDITAHYLTRPHSTFFVACDETGVIGMVGLRPMSVAHSSYHAECSQAPLPYPVPFTDPSGVLELNRMAVSPSARRRGVARALNDECVKFCRECGLSGIHLQTTIGVGGARAMYKQLGYIEYRVDRYDRMVMTRQQRAVALSAEEEPMMSVPVEQIPSLEVMTEQRERGIMWVGHYFLSA